MGTKTLIGRHDDQDDGSKPDILLFANDILPKHCSFQRPDTAGPTVICPRRDAVVTRNGETLRQEVQLGPGDVIGLGQSYLFLFKDPLALMHKVRKPSTPQIQDFKSGLQKSLLFLSWIKRKWKILSPMSLTLRCVPGL